MGYLTHYTLSSIPEGVGEEMFNANDLASYLRSRGGLVAGGEGVKWYGHDSDMLALSSKYPTVVFILDGKGEEAGDQWRKFYVAGKMEDHKAEWVAPSRPSKLEVPEYVEPHVLRVPADHLLAPALDGKVYTLTGSGLVADCLASVVVDETVVVVSRSWLDPRHQEGSSEL